MQCHAFLRRDSMALDNFFQRSTEYRVPSDGDRGLHLGEPLPPARIRRLMGNQHGLRQNGASLGFEPDYAEGSWRNAVENHQ